MGKKKGKNRARHLDESMQVMQYAGRREEEYVAATNDPPCLLGALGRESQDRGEEEKSE